MVSGRGVFMLVRRKNRVLLPLMAMLCACAGGDGRYPSLAMRPFETAPPPAAPTSPPEPIRPLADARALAALVDAAVSADDVFILQQRIAEPLARAAAGQPVESDARAAALVAMADLAARRATTTAVLADLDRLAADSAVTFAPDEEILAARGKVASLVEGQNAAMTRLWEEMGQ